VSATSKGLKYLQSLTPLLERLRPVGTARDRAGNRQLFMDQYCALILLFLFNPLVRALRSLQQASQLRNVQRKLKVSRASLGSLSEATEVFDPALLREIVGELAAQVQPLRHAGQEHLAARLVAVDGTVIKTLATIAEAAYLQDKNGRWQSAWRLHTHFDIDRHVPMQIEVTSARNGGATSEKRVLRRKLEPDHCYVKDRGYAEFKLFNEKVPSLGGPAVPPVRPPRRSCGVVCTRITRTGCVGIEIQAYCAIIACLLISLWTGRKPTLRTYEMICLYLQGWAEEDELLAHLEKLKPHAP
jgi:hypothetical protein